MLSEIWRAAWFAQDVFHEPSHVNCWCRKALKLNTSAEGLLIMISVPFSGTNAKSILANLP